MVSVRADSSLRDPTATPKYIFTTPLGVMTPFEVATPSLTTAALRSIVLINKLSDFEAH